MADLNPALLNLADAFIAFGKALQSAAARGGATGHVVVDADDNDGGKKKGKKGVPKKEKSDRKPRAATAYNLFMKETLPKIKDDGVDNKEALKVVGTMWKQLNEIQKSKYNEMAAKAKVAEGGAPGAMSEHESESESEDDDAKAKAQKEKERIEKEKKEKEKKKQPDSGKKKKKDEDSDDSSDEEDDKKKKKKKKHHKKHKKNDASDSD